MVMRITENMKFNTVVASLANVQSQYNSILEQMASQKRINRISDDPLGMTMLLDYRQAQAAIDQYQRNIDNSNGWLAMTESKLSGAGDVLIKAKELALGQGTATATAETRRIAAESVAQFKEEMLSLANSTYGDRYLFSGSRMDAAPFSATYQPTTSIGNPTASSANIFDGDVTAGGTCIGTANKTYVVKIVSGGTLAEATYQVSADGGNNNKTWGALKADLAGGTITLGDGITMTFTAGTFAADDVFSVNACAAGYYNGNGADLTIDIGKDASINYNITGESAFTGTNGGVDIFKVLDDLQSALTGNEQQGILAQVDKLTAAGSQINLSRSKVGTTMNRIELAKSNLQDLSQNFTDLTSKTEDADIVELATSLAMKELALQASYAIASKIGGNTILDFIK